VQKVISPADVEAALNRAILANFRAATYELYAYN
jgi:hypothetical protein